MINSEAEIRKARRRSRLIRAGWYLAAAVLAACAILEIIAAVIYIPWIHICSVILFAFCAVAACIIASDEYLRYSLDVCVTGSTICRCIKREAKRERNDN